VPAVLWHGTSSWLVNRAGERERLSARSQKALTGMRIEARPNSGGRLPIRSACLQGAVCIVTRAAYRFHEDGEAAGGGGLAEASLDEPLFGVRIILNVGR